MRGQLGDLEGFAWVLGSWNPTLNVTKGPPFRVVHRQRT